jgi:hypothetical protein
MTPIQYAAALLYCQEQIELCGKDGEAEDARRFATLKRDLWDEVARLGLVGRVEDKIVDFSDAPDLVRELASSLVHLYSAGSSASGDSMPSIEASRGKCA